MGALVRMKLLAVLLAFLFATFQAHPLSQSITFARSLFETDIRFRELPDDQRKVYLSAVEEAVNYNYGIFLSLSGRVLFDAHRFRFDESILPEGANETRFLAWLEQQTLIHDAAVFYETIYNGWDDDDTIEDNSEFSPLNYDSDFLSGQSRKDVEIDIQ